MVELRKDETEIAIFALVDVSSCHWDLENRISMEQELTQISRRTTFDFVIIDATSGNHITRPSSKVRYCCGLGNALSIGDDLNGALTVSYLEHQRKPLMASM